MRICPKCSKTRPKQDSYCRVCGERLVYVPVLIRFFQVLGEVIGIFLKGLAKAVGVLILVLLAIGICVVIAVVIIAVVKWAFEELAR